MPHGAVVAANNTSNDTGNNSTVIVPVQNGSLVNGTNSTIVNVSNGSNDNSSAQTFDTSSINNTSASAVSVVDTSKIIPEVVNLSNASYVKISNITEELPATNNSS
jgi:hypothetical protein